jgi:hypothetical protein
MKESYWEDEYEIQREEKRKGERVWVKRSVEGEMVGLRYQMGGIGKNGWIEFKLNDLTKWMNYFLNEHIWTNRIITTRKGNRMVWHDMATWRGCNVGDGVTGKMGRYKNKFQS